MRTTEDSSTKGLHTTDRRFENLYSGFRVYTSINKDQRTRGVSRFTTNGLALTANRCSVAVCTTLQRYGIALTTKHTVRPSWELRQGPFSLGSNPTLYQHRQLARNLTDHYDSMFTLILRVAASVDTMCRCNSISRSSNPSASPTSCGKCKIGKPIDLLAFFAALG